MIEIRKIENRYLINILSLIIIVIIGFIDHITGPKFSFSIFYLVPIALISLYKNTKSGSVLISSVFASGTWFLAEYPSQEYFHFFFPFWNAFVRFVMFAAIGLLILYLKEKHKRLNLANNSLKTLNEEKNKLIGIASHDLRNSIAGIYSLSEIMMAQHKEKLHPEVIETMSYINSLSNDSLTMLENLLDVSIIESGKVELKLEAQDYIAFIKNHISLNQLIAKNKNIGIKFSCLTDSIIAVFDKNYLGEAIDNLLSNAIKFSNPNSEITVRISLMLNKQILTEVIDNGKGIQEEDQHKLFNYFQTTTTQPTAGEKCTGLGLAIAKQIVKLHEGEIGVNSTLNQGSTFYYVIPRGVD